MVLMRMEKLWILEMSKREIIIKKKKEIKKNF